MIKAVQYLPISGEVEVLLTDNSRHEWRIDSIGNAGECRGENRTTAYSN